MDLCESKVTSFQHTASQSIYCHSQRVESGYSEKVLDKPIRNSSQENLNLITLQVLNKGLNIYPSSFVKCNTFLSLVYKVHLCSSSWKIFLGLWHPQTPKVSNIICLNSQLHSINVADIHEENSL